MGRGGWLGKVWFRKAGIVRLEVNLCKLLPVIYLAKCNLGEDKRDTMLASGLHHELYVGWSWGLAGPQ